MNDDFELRANRKAELRTDCKTFDEGLSDYLEGTLDTSVRAEMDAHAGSCVRCSSLLRDIAGIRAAAATLPELTPSRDLWQGIATRIEPAVVALSPRRFDALPKTWIGVAAAALIAATAGITYLATSRTMQSRPATVATVRASKPTGLFEATPAVKPTPEGEGAVGVAVRAPEPAASKAAVPKRGPARAQLASRGETRSVSTTEMAYATEITRLQTVIAARRKDLDPATVAVIEENLKVIDAALKRSREALARDPASGLLTDQLNSVLEKKVELLRTVALMPSRT